MQRIAVDRGLLGDQSLAEELVQETFLRLWRNAAQFDPERGSVATYIFTIARRIATLAELSQRAQSLRLTCAETAGEPHEGDPGHLLVLGLFVLAGRSRGLLGSVQSRKYV